MPTPQIPAFPGQYPWPAMQLGYYDAQAGVNSNCKQYQYIDGDPVRRFAWFVPFGGSISLDRMLVLKDFTPANFTKATSWTSIGLTAQTGVAGARGFSGGFKDSVATPTYAYFSPGKNNDPGSGAVLHCTSNASGQLNAVVVTAGGANYSVAPAPTVGGTGTGGTIGLTVSGGQVTGGAVINPGSGYGASNNNVPVSTIPALINSTTAMQVNLAQLSSALFSGGSFPAAFKAFDVSTVPGFNGSLGWWQGGYCNGTALFGTTYNLTTGVSNGTIVAYTPARGTGDKSFSDPTAWQFFDLTTLPLAGASTFTGFQSGISDFVRYIYLIAFGTAGSASAYWLRYDTTYGDITNSAAWTAFDLTTLDPVLRPRCFTGGVITPDGRIVIFPWKDNSMVPPSSSAYNNTLTPIQHAAVSYDPAKSFTDPGAYKVFDTLRLGSLLTNYPAGFEWGHIDSYGLVYMIPTGLYNKASHEPCPIVVHNSYLPFDQATSWKAYPDPGSLVSSPGNSTYQIPISVSSWYDPVTDQAWLAPFDQRGSAVDASASQGVVTRLTMIRS